MIRHQCPHPYHQAKRRKAIERNSLVFILVALLLSFALGRFFVKSVDDYRHENTLLQTSLAELTRQNKELVKQQDFVESSKMIDAQAQKDSRRSLTKLHDELSEVKEQLAFYQRVVAPETLLKGLYINSFEVKPLDVGLGYEYQLILAQGAGQKRAIKGQYTISVVGELQGAEKVLSIKDMSLGEPQATGFSFKYYEILAGELKFPNGFVPLKIEVALNSAMKGSKDIKQHWLWSEAIARD